MLTLRGPRCARRESALRDLSIIEDGSILIRDGRIVMVGPTRRIENLKEVRGVTEVSVEDAVVMPGFVDAGLRMSLLPDSGGSQPLPKPKRLAELLFDATALMRSCAEQGTLTAQLRANAGTGAFRSDSSVLRQLADLESPPVRVLRTWRIDPYATWHDLDYDYGQDFESIRQKNLAHAIEVDSRLEEAFRNRVCAAAGESGFSVNLEWPGGAVSILSDLLCRVSPRAVCVPSDLSRDECSAVAASTATAVLSPNRDLLDGRAGHAARCIIENGGAIAISSGYDQWRSPNFSMQLAFSLAVHQLHLTPEEAISAATINAAYAMGVGDITGSLEGGKKADLLVMNVSDYREITPNLGMNKVLWAMRDGKVVFDNRRASKARPN